MIQSFQGQLQNALICKSSSASNSFSRISVSFQGQLKMQLYYRIVSSHFLSTMIVSSEYILYDSSVFILHFSLQFASHCNINCTLHRRHESSLPRPVSATFYRLVALKLKIDIGLGLFTPRPQNCAIKTRRENKFNTFYRPLGQI